MYQLIRAYDDCTCGTEYVNDFKAALRACAIYLEDSSCVTVKIVKCDTGELILDYWAS